MAANKILDEFRSFVAFANDGFKYNLQVFPDTITAAALLFTLLFQSAPLGALSGSMLLLNFIHPVMANFLSQVMDGTLGIDDSARCTGHFPGVSFERLIGASSGSFGKLQAGWPSYYSTFLGFLGAYVGALPVLYHKELSASPRRQAATTTGLVVLGLVLAICIAYRIFSGCDTMFGTFIGLLSGGIIGLALVLFLAWISDRRITNILSFPLIRSRATDGKPIYVCERVKKQV
jgi:hypothetical protein